ncbi:MAG: MASE3 domain-containing protein, partial [Methanosarcina sp.]
MIDQIGMKDGDINPLITFNNSITKLLLFLIIIGILYMISLENYFLFRVTVTLFNVIIAYMVFIITWKSKTISENRYFTLIGIALFFMACVGFLRALSYPQMGLFSGYGINLPAQLWIAMRYIVSISFFVAPLLLTQVSESKTEHRRIIANDKFAQAVFFTYATITAALLLSIFKYRNFPDCYIEGSGLTDFKIFSEYIICFFFIGSLISLYWKRDWFERHVYRALVAAIIASIFAEFALIYYTSTDELLNFIGLILVALSFYFIYIAIIETCFEEPYSLLFRELKFREEALKRETNFLKGDQERIYSMLGVEKCIPENKPPIEKPQNYESQDNSRLYSSLMKHTQGLIYFRLNEERVPLSMEGAVEEMTGYSKEDFTSSRMKWAKIVTPEDSSLFKENIKMLKSNPNSSLELEYRIRKKNGEIRWVQEVIQYNSKKSGASEKFEGFIHDITQRRMAEETLARNEETRIREIHHRIKNNLQVISSLLSLQADKLNDKETLRSSEVLEAFRESQNRVVSMALI